MLRAFHLTKLSASLVFYGQTFLLLVLGLSSRFLSHFISKYETYYHLTAIALSAILFLYQNNEKNLVGTEVIFN